MDTHGHAFGAWTLPPTCVVCVCALFLRSNQFLKTPSTVLLHPNYSYKQENEG